MSSNRALKEQVEKLTKQVEALTKRVSELERGQPPSVDENENTGVAEEEAEVYSLAPLPIRAAAPEESSGGSEGEEGEEGEESSEEETEEDERTQRKRRRGSSSEGLPKPKRQRATRIDDREILRLLSEAENALSARDFTDVWSNEGHLGNQKALYKHLIALEREELVVSSLAAPRGRQCKMFEITEKGRTFLTENPEKQPPMTKPQPQMSKPEREAAALLGLERRNDLKTKIFLEKKDGKCWACFGRHVKHTCGKMDGRLAKGIEKGSCKACLGRHVKHTCQRARSRSKKGKKKAPATTEVKQPEVKLETEVEPEVEV